MSDEPGSDELLEQTGGMDPALPAESEEAALDAEEERVSSTPESGEEPGEDHPDPDEPPPADQAHDEYDPTPGPAESEPAAEPDTETEGES